MDCYSSSDPAAVNASLLFDLNNNDENLWIRTSQNLSPCPPPPPDSQCTVCLQDRVYVVCRTLADAVKLTMETETQQVNIFKSDCPELLSNDTPHWRLTVAIILILVLIVTFGVFLGYRRRSRRPPEFRRADTGTPEDHQTS